MEIASTTNSIIQIVANCVGFGLFFWLAKKQMDKRDVAFENVVVIINQILTRLAVVENDQKHMQEDIKRHENYKVKYDK